MAQPGHCGGVPPSRARHRVERSGTTPRGALPALRLRESVFSRLSAGVRSRRLQGCLWAIVLCAARTLQQQREGQAATWAKVVDQKRARWRALCTCPRMLGKHSVEGRGTALARADDPKVRAAYLLCGLR